jgi:hypothetical protein
MDPPFRADPCDAFDIVAAEILAVDDDPADWAGCRPIYEGPLRVAFRWEQEETADGVTVVTLRAWRAWPGLRGLLGRRFGPRDDAAGFSPGKRLAHVRFRAKRGSPRPA